MRRIWIALAVTALLLCQLSVSCDDGGASKGAKNTAGIAGKMKSSGSGEGGGDATSDN